MRDHVGGQGQLGQRHLRSGELARRRSWPWPAGWCSRATCSLTIDFRQLLADQRVGGSTHGPGQLHQSGRRGKPDTTAASTDGGPFVHQGGEGHRPAAVDSPSRWESGIRTSVKKTSLNEAPPVIWRNGRTSTPGACMSTTNPVRPRCLGRSGIGPADDLADVGELGARGPDLLAVHDPLVAVPDRPGLQRGQIRPRARLAEELAGDDVPAVHGSQVGLSSPPRWRGPGWSAPPCPVRCRRRPWRESCSRRPPCCRSAGTRGAAPVRRRPADR